MRKAVLSLVLAAFGGVMTSQAVVISWASDNLLSGTASARLVYITDGSTPSYNTTLQNGQELATASGAAIDGTFLYEQTTSDGTARSSGAYYVVLFNSDASQYAVSTSWVAYNDASLGTGEMDPPSTFLANGFGGWTPIPEPGSAALLALGAAALALRRRKRA